MRRRSLISSVLLLFLGSAPSASCSFVGLGASLSDDGDLDVFFSDPISPKLEPLDFTTMVNPSPPPLAEEIFSDSYGNKIGDFLATDSDPSPQCSDFLSPSLRRRIGARSDFCSSDPTQDPSSNDEAQPAGRILSAEDLENYWCSGTPRKLDITNIPVCEVALYADSSLPEQLTEGVFAEVIFCNLSLLSLFIYIFFILDFKSLLWLWVQRRGDKIAYHSE